MQYNRQVTQQHIKTDTRQYKKCTHGQREDVEFERGRKQGSQNNTHQAKTVREEYVSSQLTQSCICHAKSQGPMECVQPQDNRKEKKKNALRL